MEQKQIFGTSIIGAAKYILQTGQNGIGFKLNEKGYVEYLFEKTPEVIAAYREWKRANPITKSNTNK